MAQTAVSDTGEVRCRSRIVLGKHTALGFRRMDQGA